MRVEVYGCKGTEQFSLNSFTDGPGRNDHVSSMVGSGYFFSGQENINTDDVIDFFLYLKNNISRVKLAEI